MPVVKMSSALQTAPISPNVFFRRLCLVAVILLMSNPFLMGQGQDARLKTAVDDLTLNIKVLDLAIKKRESANLPEGGLQKANAQKLSALKDLRQHAQQFKDFADNDLVGNDIGLFENEVKAIKVQMAKLGLTPIEPMSDQQAKTSQETTAPTASTAVPQKSAVAQTSHISTTAEPTAPVVAPTSAGAVNTAAASTSTFPAPVTESNTLTFTYQLGVSPLNKGTGKFQGGCTFGSGAITSDAAVWDVVVTLLAKELKDFKPVAGGFAQKNAAGVIIVPFITMDPATHLLVNGRKPYLGDAEQNVMTSKFHFHNLSLNEVTDLLQAFGKSDATIKSAFANAAPTITVYQILVSTSNTQNTSTVWNAVVDSLIGDNAQNVTQEFLSKKLGENAGRELEIPVQGINTKVRIQPPITVPFSLPVLEGDNAAKVEAFAKRIANIGVDNIPANDDDKSKKSGLDLSDASKPIDPKALNPPVQPLIIENECFQLSFDPGIQSGSSTIGSVNPAANFRGRISYLPDNIPFGLHLRAEGETSSDNRHDRRLSGGGDFTYRSRPVAGGWYVTFGATGNYSYSDRVITGFKSLNEWRTGGKLEVQTPVQTFFPVRGGNDQKPTLTFEGLATGGNAASAKSTAFLARSTFTYTLQPTSRLFLDFNANAGWSDQARFAFRKQFTFGSFTGRYTIYKDWDFIAKYECGRKDPDYLKSCGWQTGFGLKTK